MRIFLDEFVTCGGLADQPLRAIPNSWLSEGLAMRRALEADLARLPGVKLAMLHDARLPPSEVRNATVMAITSIEQRHRAFGQLAGQADWTLLVAPEMDHVLEHLARRVLEAGGRLLGPGPDVIALAGDKQLLAEHLAGQGVRVPHGRVLSLQEPLPRCFSYPAVLKPLDGAGSLGVRFIEGPDQSDPRQDMTCPRWRLESYCAGLAASVAVIRGSGGCFPLPACAQKLSDDGSFRYLGGHCPLPMNLNRRAQALACRAVECLDGARGYLGIDLVLGEALDGGEDYVIEINPRITTSYVGLRELCRENLIGAMLDAHQGGSPRFTEGPHPVHFAPDGAITLGTAPRTALPR